MHPADERKDTSRDCDKGDNNNNNVIIILIFILRILHSLVIICIPYLFTYSIRLTIFLRENMLVL